MFLGWHDPDKKRTTLAKAQDAVAAYRQKFGTEPRVLLCNPAHGAEIADGCPLHLGGAVVDVQTRAFIPKWTFYIGVEEGTPEG